MTRPAVDVGLVLAGIAGLALFLPWVARFRSEQTRGDPRCRRCRYKVRAITSSRCPECGADLYPDGITYPGVFKPWGRRARAEIWSWSAALVWFGLAGVDVLSDGELDVVRLGLISLTLAAAWVGGVAVLLLRGRGRRHMRTVKDGSRTKDEGHGVA